MRHTIRSFLSTLGAGLLLAAPAMAESAAPAEEESPAAEEAATTETGATDVAEPPRNAGPKTPNVPGARETVPGKVHTVVRGDTLWDLSQSYLGTPWYWPKVWSYNPQIANPHWIYPGNQVRFFPAGDEGPSRVEVAEEGDKAGQPEGAEAEEDQPISPADTFSVDERPADTVEVVGKIGYAPKKMGHAVRRQGFITPKELEQAGVLSESPTEQLLLSTPDKVYLTFPKSTPVKVGDRYVLFHPGREVWSRSGKRVGYLTKLLGTVKVLGTTDKRVIARMDGTWDEVERGVRVGPYGDQDIERVSARPNDKTLKGFVLVALEPGVSLYAEHHSILVDLGSADGVQVGNTFTIIRQSDTSGMNLAIDPSREIDSRLPEEDIATCLAVDVREKASTCLLTRSLREVVEGDRVVMTPGGAVAERR